MCAQKDLEGNKYAYTVTQEIHFQGSNTKN